MWFYIYIYLYTYTFIHPFLCIYTDICRNIYTHEQIYIQNYDSKCDRKKWNWLNVCKEINTSTVSSCETSGSWENWSINLRFIRVLQLTWESRIEPGGEKMWEKKKAANLFISLTAVNQNREINSTCFNSSWNKYGIYL